VSKAAIAVRDLRVSYGEIPVVHGVSFDVAEGESLGIIGPSGCGKTTTLRAIAGLEQPSDGEISIGDRTVYGERGRIYVPTEQRRIGMVFQSYAIWPHMSVRENVAYPLRARRVRGSVDEKVSKALELVRLGGFAERRASELSGGQQQRVALARAVVDDPDVLLLDEPLSNLDARLRAEMRLEIRELQRRLGITCVYVTHDQEEAFAVADRVVVLNSGRVEQFGLPMDVYDKPASAFVASFVGSVNLIHGTVQDGDSEGGFVRVRPVGSTVSVLCTSLRSLGGAKNVIVAVRTVYPKLGATRSGSVNEWPARVARRVFLGDWIEYRVKWDEQEVVVRRPVAEPPFEEETTVFLSLDPQRCVVLPE
jgi:ABC-type Fe3+/spermidine/putrescine transport system ATPase subunit